MPITESLGALGQWNLELREDTPRELRDKIKYFGHITVHTGRVEPALVGDGLLGSSRYTGVLRGKGEADEGFSLLGCGMEFWLGDEDDKGVVIEAPLTFTAQTYTQVVADLLALTPAVVAGTLHPQVGTFTNTFQFQVLRKAIAYVATTGGHEYRVNGDGTLDYGSTEELYVTDPKCLIVKRGAGVDMDLRALLGKSDVDSDVEDFTTRVVLLAASTESQVATGDADINPALNPYKDIHGNPVKLTRMVSESTTDATNATARAQLQLNRFTGTRDALALSTTEYDINGSARIGDYLWVYNPDIGLYDLNNEVPFRGGFLNPLQLRLIETTWPVSQGFMVAYRDPDGEWLDLTDYVKWEGGQTTLKVGGFARTLTGSAGEPIGRLPQPDTSVPGVVTWIEPFLLGVYQSPVSGAARAEAILAWDTPLNEDGTPITDGSHYELAYRRATQPAYPITHDMIEDLGLTFDQLEATGATVEHMILFPETDWQTAIAPFDANSFRLQELLPAMPYEVRIRAVDLANPTNYGTWSDLAFFQTTRDDIPPATPAPPEVASSLLSVQIVHRLGIASGGEYNLDRDLHHLEVHGEYEPLFTPSETTLMGKILANWGSITGEIPVISTFTVDSVLPVYFKVVAVDEAGNKSGPSTAVTSTAQLVDDAHISDLTVSKVTAGEITAVWINSGMIKTAHAGARVELNYDGLHQYNSDGTETIFLDSENGTAEITGKLQTGLDDQRIVLDPDADGLTRMDLYDDGSTNHVTMVNFSGNFIAQRETNAARAANGGRILWTGDGRAKYGYQGPGVDTWVQFDSSAAITFQGVFAKTATLGGNGALYIDQVGGSGTFAVVTYGATFFTVPLPFVSLQYTSGSAASKYWIMALRSTTSFRVDYPSGNYDIMIWAARYA
jgi:hypothetical protein